ncbi:MAG: hypothetical protein ACYC46_08795 [Acidobacteriaceae bacterium]
MQQSRISYAWQQPDAARGYISGVSLHSHTNQSKETLDFLAKMGVEFKILRPIFASRERRCRENHGIELNYAASYWTPPLTPRLAFDLERRQIEDRLQVSALVSITDHDDINAPLLLRSVPSARHIPVSVEWTAPFADTAFHLGIHNLPSAVGTYWMETLARFTAAPSDAQLTALLAELHALPNVLIIFNHPMWDLYRIGVEQHRLRVDQFLARNAEFMHAFELNGLRSWPENREVIRLAQKWNQIVISGGDRHGVEPNANVNLTHATSFSEFVQEVRYERRSHVFFMPQYAEPWKHRILQSTLDAIRNYPDFPEGSRTWDERVYHPDANGVIRPVSELWAKGQAPRYIRYLLSTVRMMGRAPLSSSLRFAWNDPQELRMALGEQELA